MTSFVKKLSEFFRRIKQSDVGRRILGNFTIGAIGSLINVILGLVKTLLLTKSLSIGSYGTLMIVLNFYSIISIILDVKIGDILFRFYDQLKETDNLALQGIVNLSLSICIVIVSLTSLVVMFGSYWISSHVYGQVGLGPLIQIYLVGALFASFSGFSAAILRITNRFRILVVSQVLGNIIGVFCLLIYFALMKQRDLHVAVLILTFGPIVTGITSLVFSLRFVDVYSKGFTPISSLMALSKYKKTLISILFQTNLSSYLKLGSERGTVFLLSIFSTPKQVALYSVATQLISPIKLLQSNLQAALYPELVSLYNGRKFSQLSEISRNVTVASLFFGVIIVGIISIFIEPLIILVTTNEYLDSKFVFIITLIAAVITMSSICFYPLSVIMDKLRIRNLIVSLRFVYIGLISIFDISALSMAYAQLLGTTSTRLFHDQRIYRSILSKARK